MIIREIDKLKMKFYDLEIDKRTLVMMKRKELENLKERIKYLSLVTSIKDKSEFYQKILRDIHKSEDYFFEQGYFNSSSNEYFKIKELGNDKTIIKEVFYHTFMIKDLIKNDQVYTDRNMHDRCDAFYAIVDKDEINNRGKHTNSGYRAESVIQITKPIFLIDKILKDKIDVVANELNEENKDILKTMKISNIGELDLNRIRLQFDNDEKYEQHLENALNSEQLVKSLKRM